ncbi:hypothetical protein, partial [Alistipes putredinis]
QPFICHFTNFLIQPTGIVYFIPSLFLVWRSSFEAVALPDFAVGLKCESVLKMRILQDFFMHLERNC